MEGAGNDFIVVDNRRNLLSLDEWIEATPKLCDRKFGIGADGLLLLNAPEMEGVDYTMIYRNADGSDAGMCGNGGRCIARFAAENGFPNQHQFNVHENIYTADVAENEVSIHFPISVQPNKITIGGVNYIKADAATEHLICFASLRQLKEEDELREKGRTIRMDKNVNPPGSNVNFVYAEKQDKIQVQTYERGVEDLTLACGTGALASAIATHFSYKKKPTHAEIMVQMKGGTLKASFDFDSQQYSYHNLILTGPANFVFKGSINI